MKIVATAGPFFLTLIAFFFSPNARADSCAEMLTSPLTESQSHVLDSAVKSRSFEISLLSGMVNGKMRQVVLLGEFHLKNAKDKEFGQRILQQFHFRGLEGADLGRWWGGKALHLALKLSHGLIKIFSVGTLVHSTTIDDAWADQELHALATELSARMDERRPTAHELDNSVYEVNERKYSATEILNRFRGPDGTLKPAPLNLPLEAGHEPDVAEKLGSLEIAMIMGTCAGGACLQSLDVLIPGITGLQEMKQAVDNFLYVSIVPMASSTILGIWFKGKRWYNALFQIQTGLLNGRDKTMAKNIVSAFERHDDQRVILVLVGKYHLHGLKRLLHVQYGFSEPQNVN